MTEPRQLSAEELAAIDERTEKDKGNWNVFPCRVETGQVLKDRTNLRAHVAWLDVRLEDSEAERKRAEAHEGHVWDEIEYLLKHRTEQLTAAEETIKQFRLALERFADKQNWRGYAVKDGVLFGWHGVHAFPWFDAEDALKPPTPEVEGA